MGLEPDVTVALGRLELRQFDCLLLCSDGLSNKVSADELRSIVLMSRRLDAACARMIDLAKERGGSASSADGAKRSSEDVACPMPAS